MHEVLEKHKAVSKESLGTLKGSRQSCKWTLVLSQST